MSRVPVTTTRALAIAFSLILVSFWPGKVLAAESMKSMEGANGLLKESIRCKERVLKICSDEHYHWTPKLREAFLLYTKAQAKSNLQTQGKTVPEDFLAWIDTDPEMEASVYGARQNASDVLAMLYSLRLDLGKADFEKYRQLAMASALVYSKDGPKADLRHRDPITLEIHGDPRKPVDTKEPGRTLDMNDHIINFLNDNTIEEEVVIGYQEVVPELKYDDQGVAIPAPKGKPKKVPVTLKQTRTLRAADVLASMALQEKFNAVMKSKGHAVEIDCGDQVIHWKSRLMVRGERYKRINAAYLLFRNAYEAKGLLPSERDPIPSPAERCAYLIRNDKYQFPAKTQAQRKWPRFPLTAPWPVMTLLVANNQPLREREERWTAFCKTGDFRTYGEYIGPIAQQHSMQSARRLCPHPFTYGTIQMMLKDGGVCGTMGNISARSHVILGIPSTTASQPGHCAMVAFRYDPKSKTYACRGGQHATGGDDKTTPHTPWYYGDVDARKSMIYHQSIAWSVNFGMESYLDSTMVYNLYRMLPDSDRKANGATLLKSGLAINPYNFLLADAALAEASTAPEQIRFWRFFHDTLSSIHDKPGCPAESLYNKTVKSRMFANVGKLPVPEEKQSVEEVFAFLQNEQCDQPATIIAYRLALEGLPALLSRTEQDFQKHIETVQDKASRENDLACTKMAATIRATASHISDRPARKQWALSLWKLAQGREKYFGHQYRVSTLASLPFLARLSGQKMLPESEMMQPLLDQIASELEQSVAGERNLKDCRLLAAKIRAMGNSLKDPLEKGPWFESLLKIMAGHETFQPLGAKKNAKALRDPCSDIIAQTLKLLQIPESE